jgi:hypothetical protein
MLEMVLSVLAALGGGALITGGFAHWLGNLWAERLIQNEKAKLDNEIESHKVRLKKSEFIFEKEYEAASEFVAILRGILPRHAYPDMDWYEACDRIASNFGKVEHILNDYLSRHGAVLTDDTVDLLIESLAITGEGKFEVMQNEIPKSANKSANELYEKLHEVESKLLVQLRGQVTK